MYRKICIDYDDRVDGIGIYNDTGEFVNILQNNYNNLSIVERLIDVGYIYDLKPTIKETNYQRSEIKKKTLVKDDEYCFEFLFKFFEASIIYMWKNNKWYFSYKNESILKELKYFTKIVNHSGILATENHHIYDPNRNLFGNYTTYRIGGSSIWYRGTYE